MCLGARSRAINDHGFVSSLPGVVFSEVNCDDLGSCDCSEAWEVVIRLVKKAAKEEKSTQNTLVTKGRRLPTSQPKDERKIRKYGIKAMVIWNVVADGHRVGGCVK